MSGGPPSKPIAPPGRPGLRGPGVLHQRYVRRAPAAEAPAPAPTEASAGGEAAPEPQAASRQPAWATGRLVTGFICLQIGCQLALLVEAISPLRVLIRILAFGCSLLLLALVPGKRLKHPAIPLLLASTAVTALNLFHPQANSLMAGATQLGIQLAVLGPLFWVTRLGIDAATFRRTLALLFLFNAASAGVGVLQAAFPGRFQPTLSSAIEGMGETYVRSLQFETAQGTRVFRPFGLTDVPGGAATGAFYAVLLGAGFLLSSRRGLVQVLSVGGIFVGIVSLYLCQVRSLALMLVVCLLAVAGVLALKGRLLRLTKLLAVVGGLAVLGVGWAVTVGGDAVTARWNRLFEADAGEVYYSNRGYFLEGTLEYFLPEYPLGAGAGRYGMANAYFGDNSDPSRPPLWVEIQWTAWVFDGGLLVMVLYPLAVLLTALWAFRLALRRDDQGELWLWGGIIFAYDLGAIALTFSYPFFMSQAGMEFWLLNAALFGAFAHASVHAHRR
ncbi:MAG TPA: hypothetical protein VK539_15385 [Myxococcaceae bacterium]|nr:hypothetical protein [Myxococcaceae bacterium]